MCIPPVYSKISIVNPNKKDKINKAYLFSLFPIIVCILYINWNYQRTGSTAFSSIQNINLKQYNLY